MKSDSFKKITILPNRLSTVEVHVQPEMGKVTKYFNKVDGIKIFNHYSWLKYVECPFFPKILSVNLNSDSKVDLELEYIPGQPLWEEVDPSNSDAIYNACLTLFQKLSSWSHDIFGNQLPLGFGIIHGDSHLGNIIARNQIDFSDLCFVDLDSVQLGHYKTMESELILNLFSHPKCFDNIEFLKKLVSNLELDGLTPLEKWESAQKIDQKYYDYYREFKNFYQLHGILKRELERKIVASSSPLD